MAKKTAPNDRTPPQGNDNAIPTVGKIVSLKPALESYLNEHSVTMRENLSGTSMKDPDCSCNAVTGSYCSCNLVTVCTCNLVCSCNQYVCSNCSCVKYTAPCSQCSCVSRSTSSSVCCTSPCACVPVH